MDSKTVSPSRFWLNTSVFIYVILSNENNLVARCALKKKILTFWDGDKCYFFEISSYKFKKSLFPQERGLGTKGSIFCNIKFIQIYKTWFWNLTNLFIISECTTNIGFQMYLHLFNCMWHIINFEIVNRNCIGVDNIFIQIRILSISIQISHRSQKFLWEKKCQYHFASYTQLLHEKNVSLTTKLF